MSGKTRCESFRLSSPLVLESGEALPEVTIVYRTWGRLNIAGSNAVLVCHGLTGSADADVWWKGLFGPGRALDPRKDFIVCSNVLGSCYGTSGPASAASDGEPWGPRFPALTIRDMVRAQERLIRALGIRRIGLAIGGSLGGMQVLEWAVMFPELVSRIAPIATSARHSAWCIGLSEAQRQAITGDPSWSGGRYVQPPAQGLAVARMIAMCTYRSRESFERRFGRQRREDHQWEVESYLHHQGTRLVERFDANSYLTLTRAMDTHDLGRDRGEIEEVLWSIRQAALVVAIRSDILYPPAEQEVLAAAMPGAHLAWLDSEHGHDGFLIEAEALNDLVHAFRVAAEDRVERDRKGETDEEHRLSISSYL